MSTSVFGCEITLDGLHICDNTSLSWQAELLFFFLPFFPFFCVRLCRPGADLVTAVVTVSLTAILFGPLILPPAEQSAGWGGKGRGGSGRIQRQFQLSAQITFQTSQTEYLTLLWFSIRHTGDFHRLWDSIQLCLCETELPRGVQQASAEPWRCSSCPSSRYVITQTA